MKYITAMHSPKAVTVYFTSEQLLPFEFAKQIKCRAYDQVLVYLYTWPVIIIIIIIIIINMINLKWTYFIIYYVSRYVSIRIIIIMYFNLSTKMNFCDFECDTDGVYP